MDEPAAIGDLELAALISSRICHDVISPVGAIANGLEMLDEEQDEAMREQTMDLIRKSARQASAKLQFARLAFGAAGSAGAEIDLRDAERVARDFVQGVKHTLSWQGPPATLPKNKVKLLAQSRGARRRGPAARRHGQRRDQRRGACGRPSAVLAQGEPARLSEHVTSLLAGAQRHRARRPFDPTLLRAPRGRRRPA